jgi:hypothetical protein
VAIFSLDEAAGFRTTGMRLWGRAQSSFGVVMMAFNNRAA